MEQLQVIPEQSAGLIKTNLETLCSQGVNLSKQEFSILKSNEGNKIEDEDHLRQLIGNVVVLTGIKVAPEDVIIMACWKIMDHFSSFTAVNFMEAFEFNEAGVYGKRVEHFNAFLPAYMSEVLNKYRSMKNKVEFEIKKAEYANRPVAPPMSEEESYTGLMKYIEEKKAVPKFWDWNKAFLYMDENKIISTSVPERYKIRDRVLKELEVECTTAADLNDLKAIRRRITGDLLVTECRKICVTDYLKTKIS